MVILVQNQDQISFGVVHWKESTRGLCVIINSWNMLVYLGIVFLCTSQEGLGDLHTRFYLS